MEDHRQYPHGIPPWADDDLLGFYIILENQNDVEIWVGRLRYLHSLLGEKRFTVACRVLFDNVSWQSEYRHQGLPVEPLDWAGVRRALEMVSDMLESAVVHRSVLGKLMRGVLEDDEDIWLERPPEAEVEASGKRRRQKGAQ